MVKVRGCERGTLSPPLWYYETAHPRGNKSCMTNLFQLLFSALLWYMLPSAAPLLTSCIKTSPMEGIVAVVSASLHHSLVIATATVEITQEWKSHNASFVFPAAVSRAVSPSK